MGWRRGQEGQHGDDGDGDSGKKGDPDRDRALSRGVSETKVQEPLPSDWRDPKVMEEGNARIRGGGTFAPEVYIGRAR